MKVKVFIITFLSVSISLLAQESRENQESKENQDNVKIAYSNITEFGFATASFKSFAFEGTTVHGLSLQKQHHLGLGFGIGFSFCSDYQSSATGYTPLFVNYRYYFFSGRKRSPHVNVSLGGVAVKDGGGIYSSLSMGYRSGKFSFSSGLSFMAICREDEEHHYYEPYYDYNNYYNPGIVYTSPRKTWYFPVGITIKLGFSF